ncbi:NAD(P)-dependent oxidoreductase [Simiduia curdlanivorans]|uniref:SDR family oxidoreductase n=1 Tax=Simiduia curdlanivorans TaxID=1492769 RepID=A0ABV8V608_9GAMM|nr:NAD(P)-dependent oxidoreductase [Simiduia curdlanivorans]MDN3638656.1 NAD(P)-dependent oxidoreductase [Simiduia curdlanivorans]
MSLKGKTLFITGASRGIGQAIAEKAAVDGANIIIAAKTAEPHPKLAGTIYTAAKAVEAAGGQALPLVVDVRDEMQVAAAVAEAAKAFGGIDILVNNASAISLTNTEATSMKRFDLMNQINYRGTFLVTQQCLSHLKNAENPHVLTLSPPLNMDPNWFKGHVAYTISKYNMSLAMMGMAAEFSDAGIAFNCLWPKTTIATAAIAGQVGGDELAKVSRLPAIMADAAYQIFAQPAKSFSGHFLIDEDVLRGAGVNDFTAYQVDPSLEVEQLFPDLFL